MTINTKMLHEPVAAYLQIKTNKMRSRDIEWSLRAFASMRAVSLFLRARAVIIIMRAASTLEITNGEQLALRKFSATWNLSLLKRCLLSG